MGVYRTMMSDVVTLIDIGTTRKSCIKNITGQITTFAWSEARAFFGVGGVETLATGSKCN